MDITYAGKNTINHIINLLKTDYVNKDGIGKIIDEKLSNTNTSGGNTGSISWNDLEDKPFGECGYTEQEIISLIDIPFYYSSADNGYLFTDTPTNEQLTAWLGDWKQARFIWNGTEYICEPKSFYGMKCIGNIEKYAGMGDSGEPFVFVCADASSMFGTDVLMVLDLSTDPPDDITSMATVNNTVQVILLTAQIKKLSTKYIENIDYEKQVINKPFGVIPSGTVITDQTVVTQQDVNVSYIYVPLIGIQTISYDVTWQGTTYGCTAIENEGQYMIGNQVHRGGEDTGEPFLIIDDYSQNISIIIANSDAGEYTFSIKTAEETYKKIDNKYLPKDIGGDVLPKVSDSDNGKVMQVVDGKWVAINVANSEVATYIDEYISEALGGDY